MMYDMGRPRRHISQHRFLTLAILAVLWAGCAALPPSEKTDGLECHFIDVGYGDAILIRKGEAAIFIDGGYPPMTAVVLDHFSTHGLTHLDTLVLTHPHPDHIGGAFGIIQSGFPLKEICSAYPLDHPEIPRGFRQLVQEKIDQGQIGFRVLRDGERIALPGNLIFNVIHPDILSPDMNNSSMVLYCPEFDDGLLLTADIGRETQQRIVEHHPEIFPVTILKAPYHGGKALEAFYRLARPQLTVVTDGVNPYGNPCQDALAAAEKYSRQVVRLFRSGTVIVRQTHQNAAGFDIAHKGSRHL